MHKLIKPTWAFIGIIQMPNLVNLHQGPKSKKVKPSLQASINHQRHCPSLHLMAYSKTIQRNNRDLLHKIRRVENNFRISVPLVEEADL